MDDTPPSGGFWNSHDPDDYKTLPQFLKPEETAKLIDERTPLDIVAIRPGKVNGDQVHYVDVVVGDLHETRTKSFQAGVVVGRDALLSDMIAYLQAGGDPIPVIFVHWGKAIGIEGRDDGTADFGDKPEVPPEPHAARIGAPETKTTGGAVAAS